MSKYYVNDGLERAVIMSASPTQACVDCLLKEKFVNAMVNGYYVVNETGFANEPTDHGEVNGVYIKVGDYLIPSDMVNEMYLKQKGLV